MTVLRSGDAAAVVATVAASANDDERDYEDTDDK